jgi:hypothetical protein
MLEHKKTKIAATKKNRDASLVRFTSRQFVLLSRDIIPKYRICLGMNSWLLNFFMTYVHGKTDRISGQKESGKTYISHAFKHRKVYMAGHQT